MEIILEEKSKLVTINDRKIVITRYNGDILEVMANDMSEQDLKTIQDFKDFLDKINEKL